MSLVALLVVSCTSSDDNLDGGFEKKNIKSSEMMVYSGANLLGSTRAIDWKSEVGYSIPDDGKYLVYYFIRIDGNIPGEGKITNLAQQYFPRTSAKKSMICDLNHGYVKADAPWKSGWFDKYIYASDGLAVQDVILEEPTLEDIVAANKYAADDFSDYLAHKDELHFLWYVCKQQSKSDHTWHIDGILTSKDRTDITQTDYGKEIIDNYEGKGMEDDRKAHVEVDIHQQEHKDWNEIKTSIHMRDTVSVEVFLPIGYQELADDFNIRAGKDFEYVTEIKTAEIQIGEQKFQVEAKIIHEEGGIRILIDPNKEALKAAREAYQDGITFEIHSYVTSGITKDVIWDKLKMSTCHTEPYTKIFGQITSAFYDDEVKF